MPDSVAHQPHQRETPVSLSGHRPARSSRARDPRTAALGGPQAAALGPAGGGTGARRRRRRHAGTAFLSAVPARL